MDFHGISCGYHAREGYNSKTPSDEAQAEAHLTNKWNN
jgi:hypothetical protein